MTDLKANLEEFPTYGGRFGKFKGLPYFSGTCFFIH